MSSLFVLGVIGLMLGATGLMWCVLLSSWSDMEELTNPSNFKKEPDLELDKYKEEALHKEKCRNLKICHVCGKELKATNIDPTDTFTAIIEYRCAEHGLMFSECNFLKD